MKFGKSLTVFITIASLAIGMQVGSAQIPKKYALLIGINNYEGAGLRSLKWAENDVNELAEVLDQIGYDVVAVMTETEGNKPGQSRLRPTRENILVKLEQFCMADIGKGGHLLLAFAGHGIQFNDEPYFCPIDVLVNAEGPGGDPQKDKRLISLSEVKKHLDGAKAGLRVMLCDACRLNDSKQLEKPKKDVPRTFEDNASIAFDYSNLIKHQPRGANKEQPRGADKNQPRGADWLFSCSTNQLAYENSDIKHGWYFHFVIEGLRGKADTGPADGKITVAELHEYAREQVTDAVEALKLQEKGHLAKQQPHHVEGSNHGIPLAIFPERMATWTPSQMWTGDEWSPSYGDIEKVDEKHKYFKVITRTIVDPNTKERIEVRFRFIPDGGRQHRFYMMENKVSRKLFHCFARQNPDQLDPDDDNIQNPWRVLAKRELTEQDSPSHPACEVSHNEATQFAKWLNGYLPILDEWDVAAGFVDWKQGQNTAEGPFVNPINPKRERKIAIGLKEPSDVGTSTHDVSIHSIRDMAGNGMEWTAKNAFGFSILRGQRFDSEEPLRFVDLVERDKDAPIIAKPERRSRYWSFRVVLHVDRKEPNVHSERVKE